MVEDELLARGVQVRVGRRVVDRSVHLPLRSAVDSFRSFVSTIGIDESHITVSIVVVHCVSLECTHLSWFSVADASSFILGHIGS